MLDNRKKWIKVLLTDISEIVMGQSPPSSSYNYEKIGLPFFQGKAEFGKLYPKAIKYCSEPKKISEKDDILISVRAPVGPTNISLEKSCIGRGLAAIRPKGEIPFMFLLFYLRYIEEWLAKQGTGSTFTAISKQILHNIEVLLPPLNEQKCIVEKLDKLLAKVESAKARLEKIPGLLKRFRQSVLAAAISGELTKDWREENRTDINFNLKIQELKNKRVSSASSHSQLKKIIDIYDYVEKNENNLPISKWKYICLDKLCKSFDYGTSRKSAKVGKIPVLRMGNIQNGQIDWEDLVYTSDEKEINKYLLKPNTVLFNRTNSPELVGKTAIFTGNRKAIFAGYLIRINNYEFLNSKFLNYCLNSDYAKEYCLKVKSDGVSQSNINAQKLGKFEVPFCDIKEQNEIVNKIETLFKITDQIEERYKKAKSYVDKLQQSILEKAFSGELVPQNPNDEPAEKLLERIKQENAKISVKNVMRAKGAKIKIKGGRVNMQKKEINLLKILQKEDKPLTPEELFKFSKYDNKFNTDDIEQFYLELKKYINEEKIIEKNKKLELAKV